MSGRGGKPRDAGQAQAEQVRTRWSGSRGGGKDGQVLRLRSHPEGFRTTGHRSMSVVRIRPLAVRARAPRSHRRTRVSFRRTRGQARRSGLSGRGGRCRDERSTGGTRGPRVEREGDRTTRASLSRVTLTVTHSAMLRQPQRCPLMYAPCTMRRRCADFGAWRTSSCRCEPLFRGLLVRAERKSSLASPATRPRTPRSCRSVGPEGAPWPWRWPPRALEADRS